MLTRVADAAISIGVKHFNHYLISLQKFTDKNRKTLNNHFDEAYTS